MPALDETSNNLPTESWAADGRLLKVTFLQFFDFVTFMSMDSPCLHVPPPYVLMRRMLKHRMPLPLSCMGPIAVHQQMSCTARVTQ